MSTNLMQEGVDYGIGLVALLVPVFFLNQIGLMAWFWWATRRKDRKQDSSVMAYWNAHE
jgi:hypothetical protein